MRKITGITIKGKKQPWNVNNQDEVDITILEADAEENRYVAKIGDEVFDMSSEGYIRSGSDPVACAICQVMNHVYDDGDEEDGGWSGYLHNYVFLKGYAVEDDGDTPEGFVTISG